MVNEMNEYWMVIIGLLSGTIGMSAIPLSFFIRKVEDDTVCNQCVQRNSCFAQKPLFGGKSNWLSECMLISYCKIRRTCPCVVSGSPKNYILYVFLNMVLVSVPFWSEGMNLIGVLYGISGAALLSLSVVDWNTQYIPLEMSGIIFICGLIRLCLDLSNWLEYVIGLFAVSGFLFLLDKLSVPVLKKRYAETDVELDSAIGDGDIKLMAATGLLLGWRLNFLALGIGCIAGSVIHMILMAVKKGDRQLALGPYLSLGVYITMICGKQLVSWYMNMIGVMPL